METTSRSAPPKLDPAPGRAAAATPVIAVAIDAKYPKSGQALEKYEGQIWILLRLIWESLRPVWKSLRLAWIVLRVIWNSDRRGRAPVMESAAVRQPKIPLAEQGVNN